MFLVVVGARGRRPSFAPNLADAGIKGIKGLTLLRSVSVNLA